MNLDIIENYLLKSEPIFYEIILDEKFIYNIFNRVNTLIKHNQKRSFYKMLHNAAQLELESLLNEIGLEVKSHNVKNKNFKQSINIHNLDKVVETTQVVEHVFNQKYPFHHIYNHDNYDTRNIASIDFMMITINEDGVIDKNKICIDGVVYTAEDNNFDIDEIPKKDTVTIDGFSLEIDDLGNLYIDNRVAEWNEDEDEVLSLDGKMLKDTLHIYNQLLEVKDSVWYINGEVLSATNEKMFIEKQILKEEAITFEFCNSYGIDSYSIEALNYLQSTPNISFKGYSQFDKPSLGNYLLYVDNNDYDIQIKTAYGVKLVSYAYHISIAIEAEVARV
ncbi:MAG: hypothetical protein ACI9TV_000673 [Sulfurimonas sp.]